MKNNHDQIDKIGRTTTRTWLTIYLGQILIDLAVRAALIAITGAIAYGLIWYYH